jgi:hypothetical protein
MTEQQDRDAESAETSDTPYDRLIEEEAARRHEAAERLKRDPLPEPDES